jgi:hypothetical protein
MCVREKVRVRVPLDVLSRTGFHIHCNEAFSSSWSIEIFRCIIFRRIIDACVLTCVRACVCRSQDCGNSTYANSTRRTSCLSTARHDSVRTTSGALMSIVLQSPPNPATRRHKNPHAHTRTSIRTQTIAQACARARACMRARTNAQRNTETASMLVSCAAHIRLEMDARHTSTAKDLAHPYRRRK